MATREELEGRINWQATFRLTRKPIPQFACLMQSVNGGHYWRYPVNTPDAVGSTMAYSASALIDSLDRGILELVAWDQKNDLPEKPATGPVYPFGQLQADGSMLHCDCVCCQRARYESRYGGVIFTGRRVTKANALVKAAEAKVTAARAAMEAAVVALAKARIVAKIEQRSN